MSFDFRAQRGEAIAQMEGAVKRLDEGSYLVRSQSGDGAYHVVSGENGWICPCPDATFRGVKCKHIWGVEFSRRLRERVAKQVVIRPIEVQSCPRCRSEEITKAGLRHNQSGDIQRYNCKNCDIGSRSIWGSSA
jgi:hypothetical protein